MHLPTGRQQPFQNRYSSFYVINPLTTNELQRRRAVSPLKIKIPSKNLGR
jgi:hypothetical protein